MNEHGWNDPPVFTYSSLQTGATRQTQLTRRVNHDISTGPSQTKPLSSTDDTHTSQGPPIVTKEQVTPPPLVDSVSPKDIDSTVDVDPLVDATPSGTCVKTFDNVLQSLEQIVDEHKESMQSRTSNEIKSRLKFLSEQWRNSKLSAKVQEEMTRLTSALENGDYSLADKIHISLMVDHVSEVSKWMVGVKRLIATLKQQGRTGVQS